MDRRARPEAGRRLGRLLMTGALCACFGLVACTFEDPGPGTTLDRPDGDDLPSAPDALPEAGFPDAGVEVPAVEARPVDVVDAVDAADEALPPPDLAPPVETAPELPPPDLAPPVDPLLVGLVARWRFDEGMGTGAGDATGNGNVATLHNGAGWEKSGVPGAAAAGDFALRLDGVDDYLTARVTTIPAIEAPKSIAFWLAADRSVGLGDPGQRSCVSLFSEMPRAGVQVGFDRGRPAAWLRGADRGLVTAGGVPGPGFHHFVYTYDGRTHRLWIDAREVASAETPSPSARVSHFFVGTFEVPHEMCPGLMDDLRIYDRALLPDDVRDLARAR